MDQCKPIMECLALNSVLMDKEIFYTKMFYLIESVHGNIGMLIIRFGVDG